MKSNGAMARFSILALAGSLLVACGGGSESVTRLSGAVVNDDGVSIASAPVVFLNRQTEERFSTQTTDNGRYTLDLPNGHYDAIAADANGHDLQGVSLLSLGGGELGFDFALPETTADDATVVSGQVIDRDGRPAANHVVQLSSNMSTGDIEPLLRLSTRTDANGHFKFDGVEGARMFDIDVKDEETGFEEFIDFPKAEGAVRLLIRLGDAATHNTTRHDRVRAADDRATAAAAPAPAAVARTASINVNEPFDFTNKVAPFLRDYSNPYGGEPYDDYACQERTTDAAGLDVSPDERENYQIRGYCKGELSGGKLNDGDESELTLADGLPLDEVAAIMGLEVYDGRLMLSVDNMGSSYWGAGGLQLRNRYRAVDDGEHPKQVCTDIKVELENGDTYKHAGWSTSDWFATTKISFSKGTGWGGGGGTDRQQAVTRVTTNCYFDKPND